MMIPTIVISKGAAVRFERGQWVAAGDPAMLMPRYALSFEVGLIDLDAANQTGDNRALIEALVGQYPCRVGGGIRTASDATRLLDAGAEEIIVDPAADAVFETGLPRERVLAAVSLEAGQEVTGEGLRAQPPGERIASLRDRVGGFVVTDTGRNGQALDEAVVRSLVSAAGKRASITMAGGVRTAAQIADLDRLGADAQVGTALLEGDLELADGMVAPIRTDRPDGLYATVVVDALGQAIGLVYSDMESIREAVERKMGAYHSRSRGLWVKGLTSGNTQELLGIRLDCDRDALYFMVTQTGAGFCHKDTWTCWGEDRGIGRLSRFLRGAPGQRASELRGRAEALASAGDKADVVEAASDLLMTTLSFMSAAGVGFEEVEERMYKKSLRVTDRVPARERS